MVSTGCRIGRVRLKGGARVYVLPGVERRDLSLAPPANQVLSEAMKKGLSDVVLVGVDRAGELYVAGSYRDGDRAVGALMRGVTLIAGGRMKGPDGDVLEPEPAA